MNIFDWSDRLKLHKSTGFVSAPGLKHVSSDSGLFDPDTKICTLSPGLQELRYLVPSPKRR